MYIQDLQLGRHCQDVARVPPLSIMRVEELSRSLRGGSGANLPTLILSSYSLHLTKRTHSFVWFRSVFSLVLPRNQISKNSSLFLVYSKVYSCIVCLWDRLHLLVANKNNIANNFLIHTRTYTNRYACYQSESRTHGGQTLYSSQLLSTRFKWENWFVTLDFPSDLVDAIMGMYQLDTSSDVQDEKKEEHMSTWVNSLTI